MVETLAAAIARSGKSPRQRVELLHSSLKQKFAQHTSHWQSLANYYLPRRIRIQVTDQDRGDRRNQHIIDSTGVFAAEVLASGMYSGKTSPALPWFAMQAPNPELRRNKGVQSYLKETTEILLELMADSNLYQCFHEGFLDLGVFGQTAMAVLPDSLDAFRAEIYPIGSYCVGINAKRRPHIFCYEYQCDVLQLVEQFGVQADGRTVDWSRISTAARALFEAGNMTAPVHVVWVVMPNWEYRKDRLEAKYKRFVSVHYEQGTGDGPDRDVFLRESGYDTFPFMFPRWAVTGTDTCATSSPGMVGLGDNAQLQTQNKYEGKAIIKMVEPPLIGEHELRNQPISQIPGGVTFVSNPQHGLRPLYEVRLGLDQLSKSMDRTAMRINRAFFVDLFQAIIGDPRNERQTAEEIRARMQEKMLGLGAVLERIDTEYLDPCIDRCWDLADAAGYLPEPPEELRGVRLRPEYTSILSQAQKLASLGKTDRFLASVGAMAELFPAALHKVRVFKAVDIYGDQTGVDPDLVLSDEEAEAGAARAAEQQQAAANAQNAALMAKATKDAAGAQMGTDSALDRVVQTVAAR